MKVARVLVTKVLGLLLFVVGRLSRQNKQAILYLLDVVLAPLSLLLAARFVYPTLSIEALIERNLVGAGVVVGITAAGSLLLGIPNIKLKAYESVGVAKTCILAVAAALGLLVLRQTVGLILPGSGIALFAFVFILLMIISRFALLHLLLAVLRVGKVRRNVVIYGAGTTGTQLAAALRGHETIRVVAFVDDCAKVQGMTVSGLIVYPPARIEALVARHDVERVLLAMPSAPLSRQATVARNLLGKGLEVQSLPSFAQLVGAETIVDTLEPFSAGAFLGRAQHDILQPVANSAYSGKCIMVTGAGGSVGSELCRQLIAYKPRKIVLFDSSEIALYSINREFEASPEAGGIEFVPLLGSVTESRVVRSAIAHNKVDVILHAAAYKHVPLVEANPIAGIVNNVLGTATLAEAALHENVQRFILISTDKAVRPTNVMGASKRMAEFVVQDMARRSDRTDFSIVRFGNVLGSSGSVVPLFKEQIAKGGPVTLTHEDVTRYFMTISEAANLVLISGALSSSRGPHQGDLFVLDMGKPVRIRDLAERMIKAAGYEVKSAEHPEGDIEIVITGLRPGEKVHEELLIEPGMLTTPHEKILRVQEKGLTAIQMTSALRQLRSAVAVGNADAALAVIEIYVEGYRGSKVEYARLA